MADPLSTVRAYLDTAGRHDVEGALDFLADDFELEFAGGAAMDKRGMRSALGWDAGTEGVMEWEAVDEGTGEVSIAGRERNEFFRLLGVEFLSFRSRFRLDDKGKISHQHYEMDGPGAGYAEALEEAVAWAREHEPRELEEIYPGGQIHYSEEAGRRWVALLGRWRAETG